MRTTRTQPIDWLFPRARKRALTLLLMDAGKSWHLREIVRRTDCSPATVQRELKGLAACGIALARRDGNRTLYQANTQCPIYPELKGLITKTTGAGDTLRDTLLSIESRLKVGFIYGSMARGEEKTGSDVDVMIIGAATFDEVVKALRPAEEQIGREVNPTVYSPVEFREKVASKHHFVTTVLRERKIFLIGDENELERLAAQ